MPSEELLPELQSIMSLIERYPDGIGIAEIQVKVGDSIPRRTLNRRLARLVEQGRVQRRGSARHARYFLSVPASSVDPAEYVVAEPFPQAYVPLADDAQQVRALIQRPISQRPSVGYQRGFLDAYEPNKTHYLEEKVRNHLRQLGRLPDGGRPAGSYARQILNRLLIDLSWASSRLEGNTYSLLDTQKLIEAGEAAEGKNLEETRMILNHKAAIEMLVDSAAEIGVNRFTILNLHALLAEGLLGNPQDVGRLRTGLVGIGGSVYSPPAIPQLIDEMFRLILDKGAAIEDPFEQSFFLMVHLPYLQPFMDVNKRTSRLAANIPLIKQNCVPLSFIAMPERSYTEGVLAIYELNRVELLRDVYIWAYERSCHRYRSARDSLPAPDPFRMRYRAALSDVIQRIASQGLRPDAHHVRELAKAVVEPTDLERFVEMTVRELEGLHEGNIVRHRLRLSEFAQWQRAVAGKGDE